MNRFFGAFKKCVLFVAVLTMLVNNIGFVYAGETEPVLIDLSESNTSITVDPIPDQPYTGKAINGDQLKSIIKVKYGDIQLKYGDDYWASYSNNVSISNETRASIVIHGIPDAGYTGIRTIYFSIVEKKDLSDAEVVLYMDKQHTNSFDYCTYKGTAIIPYEVVTLYGKTLTRVNEEGIGDYTVSYRNNINPSSSNTEAEVIIKAKENGDYTGTYIKKFAIIPKDAEINTNATFDTLTYKGENQQFILTPYLSDDAEYFKYGWYPSVDSEEVPSSTYTNYNDINLGKKNAGTYKLYVEMVPKKGYTFEPFSVNLTIAKKNPEVVAPTLATNLTFNNDDRELITAAATPDSIDSAEIDDNRETCTFYYAVTTVNTAPAADAENTWVTDFKDITGKNAGDYYIWYKATGTTNLNDIAPTSAGTVTIAKFKPKIADAYTDQEKTYTSLPISVDDLDNYLVLAGEGETKDTYLSTIHGTITYDYYKCIEFNTTGVYETTATTAPTDTNEEKPYKVVVTLPESANYESVTKTILLTIKIADLDVTAPELQDVTYNGQEQSFIKTPASSVLEDTETPMGTIKYTVTNEELETLTNSEIWSIDATGKDAGTYKVWYMAESNDTGNYNSSTPVSAGTAKVNKATPTINISSKTVDYDRQPKTLDAATVTLVNNEVFSGTITYEYKVSTALDTTYSTTAPTDVGIYTVKASIDAQGNYNSASETATLTISKIAQNPTPPVLNDDTLTYIKDDITLIETAAVVQEDCVAYYAFGESATTLGTSPSWSTEFLKGKDAKTYYIWYKVDCDKNYEDYKATYVGSVTIGKANQTVTAPELSADTNYDPTFATTPYNLIKTGASAVLTGTSTSVGTIKYLITATDAATPTGSESGWDTTAKASKAGTYKVWYMSVSDNEDNYNSSSPTAAGVVTISKIDPEVSSEPTLVVDDINYDGTAKQLIATAGTVTDTCTIKYAVSDTAGAPSDESAWKSSYTAITKTNAGTYYVYYKVVGNDNYKDLSAKLIENKTKEIKKVAPTLTAPTGISNLAYTGSAVQLITQGSVTGGTLYYGFGTDTAEPTTWKTAYTDINKVAIGTYYVWYKVNGDNNHTSITATKIGPIKIDKATVTLKVTQELNGDLIVTTEPLSAEYLNSLANSGSLVLTFPSGGTETVTIPSNKIQKVIENSKTKALKIPYSQFESKNKVIDKFKSDGKPNTIDVVPSSVTNFNDTSAKAVTTRGIEYINLYEQKGSGQLTTADKNLGTNAEFYIDGKKLTTTEAKKVKIVDNETKIVQTFKYYNNKAITDSSNYPTGFSVYQITQTKTTIDGVQTYKATLKHLEGLDNSMKYQGTSIKVVPNETNGIRIKTSIPKTTRANLIEKNVEGYTLVEYGTMMAWANSVENGMPYLVQGQSGVYTACASAIKPKAYSKAENYDQVFSTDASNIIYTNVLTESGSSWSGKLNNNVVFRSYMILRPVGGDATKDIVIYNGPVYRSIYYIAKQYVGTDFYNSGAEVKAYIDKIIKAVESPQ